MAPFSQKFGYINDPDPPTRAQAPWRDVPNESHWLSTDVPKKRKKNKVRKRAKDLPAMVETEYGLPQLYLMKTKDQDSYFLALERQKNGAYKGLQVTWQHDKRNPSKAVQASQLVARDRQELGFQPIKLKDVPQEVVARFDARLAKG